MSALMSDLQTQIEAALRAAVTKALGDAYADADPLVTPATNPKFGDYQANLAMGLAKRVGAKPRDLAEQIVAALGRGDVIARAEIAGPGFINLTVTSEALRRALADQLADERLGAGDAARRQTVVIDYASPNLAKEMHIGHLRSSIIGDSLARVLDFMGHAVIRHNHIGDWGTQFGLLLEHLIDTGWAASDDHTIGDLNALYQEAKQRDDQDPAFAERARQRVVALQSGDPRAREIWRQLIDESVRHMNLVFQQLGVTLTDGDLKPESFYNNRLPGVVDALDEAGLLRDLDGAKVVYVEGFIDRDGEPLPMAIRKSDGGFGYPATDLAAVRYRTDELNADRLIYVVDSRQRDHFAQVFALTRSAGWVDGSVELVHVGFGTIMGKDRKPFKTREGGTVRLMDVLHEVVHRAEAVIAEKNPELGAEEKQRIARVVGIGAVKYADLSNDRIKDYIFDWDRMLAMEGNTAPYLQYSYVRIQSIFRKAEAQGLASPGAEVKVQVTEEAERLLAQQLLQFPRVVAAVAQSLEPHRLCTYLYELATRYHKFYEHCPVLKADDAARRESRLALCALVARTLERGLGLLGIDVVERM